MSRHQPVCKMPGGLSRFFCFCFLASDVLYNLENENEPSMDIHHPVRNSTSEVSEKVSDENTEPSRKIY